VKHWKYPYSLNLFEDNGKTHELLLHAGGKVRGGGFTFDLKKK